MSRNFLPCELNNVVSSLVLVMTYICGASIGAQAFEKSASFQQAEMTFDGETLIVSTGLVARQWKLTSRGFKTVGLKTADYDCCEISNCAEDACDWNIGGLHQAKLVSLAAEKDNDERFTSDHLGVVAEFVYPHDKLRLRYVIWAYPQAAGLRTQVELKAMPGYDVAKPFAPQVVDSFEFTMPWSSRLAFGLMQGIKTNMNVSILREKVLTERSTQVDWANGMVLQGDKQGVILLKESNKHTALQENDDLATGAFVSEGNHVKVTGVGMFPNDVNSDAFQSCWATWMVVYEGEKWQGNLALKQFDRLRYPIDPDRDIYIMANTWGTEDLRPPCLHAAREENVLKELESVANLGIDVLQIDDGWQTAQWSPAASAKQVQHGKGAVKAFGDYRVYPAGWSNVRNKAEELGVTLGLWAAWTAPTEALQSNYDQGNFKYFKLDFARLNTKSRFENLATKARNLIKHSDYTARVNWDVTEIAARMGYFCGREYGNIYLANRKTKTVRDPVLYVPHKVLNDAWHLSKYTNLNKFQVTVQNVDQVPPDAKTDAGKHGHDYAVGISLMSSPIFFQETRHYSSIARESIRRLLSVYKQHRRAMFDGYVFPIGAEPDNRSWTGFQNHDPRTKSGYLTIFRERLNELPNGTFDLKFVEEAELKFTNLLTNSTTSRKVGSNGEVDFGIPEAPGFLFLRYETQ